MNTVIYARVSTGAKHNQTNENQILLLKEFCQNKGWKVVDIYTDVITGSSRLEERDGYKKMMIDIHQKRNKIENVVFFALDRISRNGISDVISALEYFTNNGVSYCSYSEPFINSTNSNSFTSALVGIVATLAKVEKENLKRRISAGLRRASAQGKTCHRIATVDVNRVLELRKQGKSYRAIAAVVGCTAARACQLCKAELVA